MVVLPCLPDEVLGLSVARAGRSVGKIVDVALLDARHARYFLVRRPSDGRIFRVLAEEVVSIRAGGVELAANAALATGD